MDPPDGAMSAMLHDRDLSLEDDYFLGLGRQKRPKCPDVRIHCDNGRL